MKKIVLTGDRPTGKLHLGHYVGSLKQRVDLQDKGNDKMYVMIADSQALTDNSGNPQKVRDNVIELMLDYLSIGLNPEKITFFVQSGIRALPELTAYYMNLVGLSRLLRNPTVKSEIQQRGYNKSDKSIPVGFANYPISQAADITAFNATIIPVGEDQLPMIELTREIVKTFNSTYDCNVLSMPEPVIPDNKFSCRLPGIDGNAKMSKSLNNCIYLSDDEETLKNKVYSMYTDPNHKKISDPGSIIGNIVFTYLDVFATDLHFEKYYKDFKNLSELKKQYQLGGIGDMRIKKFLYDILNELLEPIRERRKFYEDKIEYIYKILKEGTIEANKDADECLDKVKDAMNINYFKNDNYLIEQKNRYE